MFFQRSLTLGRSLLPRPFQNLRAPLATPRRNMTVQMPVKLTPEGAVSISYPHLLLNPESLAPSIEKAFGSDPDCLGLIVVTDLPSEYPGKRDRLLKLAERFANLDDRVKQKYEDPKTTYSFGWSHGKEIMNGKPDTLKGSYYANPTIDEPNVSAELRANFAEYYGKNIWPSPSEKGVEGFEEAFKDLGQFVHKVGIDLARACQTFVSSHLADRSTSLAELIATSQTTKARLLHYFPPPPLEGVEADDSYCGTHLDNSMLTGLCSAMYLRHSETGEALPTIVPPPASDSGLYIHTRGGEIKKISIPKDALAFQTGEALELCTAGRLRATPHLVKAGARVEGAGVVSRETFALFMQPDCEQVLSENETFGSFSKKIFAKHYDSGGSM